MSYKITREKFLTQEERRKLLKVCQEIAELDLMKGRVTWPTRFMLVNLALRSGLRVGEISGLLIGDLHLNGKDNYIAVRKGKRGKARDVYIDAELTKHLKDYPRLKKQSWRLGIEPDDYLLTSLKGRPYTTTALHISFKKALENAGITRKGISIHSARQHLCPRCSGYFQ